MEQGVNVNYYIYMAEVFRFSPPKWSECRLCIPFYTNNVYHSKMPTVQTPKHMFQYAGVQQALIFFSQAKIGPSISCWYQDEPKSVRIDDMFWVIFKAPNIGFKPITPYAEVVFVSNDSCLCCLICSGYTSHISLSKIHTRIGIIATIITCRSLNTFSKNVKKKNTEKTNNKRTSVKKIET